MPLSAGFPPLSSASEGRTVEFVRLKKERKKRVGFFWGGFWTCQTVLFGSCGNEGRGGVEVDIFRRALEVAALQGIMGRKKQGQGS